MNFIMSFLIAAFKELSKKKYRSIILDILIILVWLILFKDYTSLKELLFIIISERIKKYFL